MALDPADAEGYLNAARTLAEHKEFDRAWPSAGRPPCSNPTAANLTQMRWLTRSSVKTARQWNGRSASSSSQDWASDNQTLHDMAQNRVKTLSQVFQAENHGSRSRQAQAGRTTLRRRDLVINLTWDTGSQPADLELEVKEPTGTVCSAQQKQTPGGGILLGTNLVDMSKASYMAAEAFSGEYEIKVRRLFGQPLAGRAFRGDHPKSWHAAGKEDQGSDSPG